MIRKMSYSNPKLYSILNLPYYHGEISAKEANQLLKGRKPGTFLLRDSSLRYSDFQKYFLHKTPLAISWSVDEETILHDRIAMYIDGYFSIDEDYEMRVSKFRDIPELISHYSTTSELESLIYPRTVNPLLRNYPFSLEFQCKHAVLYNNVPLPDILRKTLIRT